MVLSRIHGGITLDTGPGVAAPKDAAIHIRLCDPMVRSDGAIRRCDPMVRSDGAVRRRLAAARPTHLVWYRQGDFRGFP